MKRTFSGNLSVTNTTKCPLRPKSGDLSVKRRQFHNPKPLLRLDFLSIEKGVPPQILEVIGDQTDTRERKEVI
ncbi:hypothetical protein, partial [Paenibacillus typhae]|uniref:hypothetical protein n=1 Tax=Paenibacillus typhae TaxID=1174501 RepID=UPI0039F0AFDF